MSGTRITQPVRKPELLATAGSPDEAKRLFEAGADALNVGEQAFGLHLPGDMGPDEIAETVRYAHEREKRVYVVCNKLFENEELSALTDYLRTLGKIGVDAVVFGDPAVVVAMREANAKLSLHWNAEMTSTNYESANYWGTKGATRVFLARELNLEQVAEFKRRCRIEVQVQVHGMTNIYHSKRALLESYLDHLGERVELIDLGPERGLYLIEPDRPDERFPIFEDANGTHIMSSSDICMLENLHELLELNLDSLKIEGLLKSVVYNETVVRAYRTAIDAYAADPDNYGFREEWLRPILDLQDPKRELTFGFFYKEQVY